MGRSKKSGYGFGMDEYSARQDFEKILNYENGHTIYSGSAEDITQYLKSKCVTPPKQEKNPEKVTIKKVPKNPNLKIVNGFFITNEISENIKNFLLKNGVNEQFVVVKEYFTDIKEAKEKATILGLKRGEIFEIIPSKVAINQKDNKVTEASSLFQVKPEAKVEAQKGKWLFEVEVRC